MPTDKIVLKGMRFYGYHGVNPEEKELGQAYLVDLEADADLGVPGKTDNLEDTISYTHLFRTVRSVVEGESRNLLEAVAEEIARRLLTDFSLEGVAVTVKKPHPPVKGSSIDFAAVSIHRRRDHY